MLLKFISIVNNIDPQIGAKIINGETLMGCVYYFILPERLKIMDFTYPLDISTLSFAMREPFKKIRWGNFSIPYTRRVWLCVMAVTSILPIAIIIVIIILKLFVEM